MATYGDAVRIMFKRPFAILYFSLITLVGCGIGRYNPVSTLLYGFGTFGIGNLLDSILSLIRLSIGFLSKWNTALKAALITLGLLAAVSLLIGLAFSGLLGIINNAVDSKPKFKGELVWGIKKYFSRTAWISFKVLFFSLLFVIFAAVASVPAIMITKAWLGGNSGLLLSAVFFDALTAGVLALGLLFFRAYMFFWYPAALNVGKGAFLRGKRTVDSFFWSFAARLVAVDIAYGVYQFLFIYVQGMMGQQNPPNMAVNMMLFFVNWIFKTLLFSSLVFYVFLAFKTHREELNAA
ncbi:MAG: hypothetical protein QHH06_08650 [Clostridiales bacterium]|nr:hypothetical protein [Eubacteriales bacterium]MDH7566536.1 hypothetical protein [Clostridiales bacterium]